MSQVESPSAEIQPEPKESSFWQDWHFLIMPLLLVLVLTISTISGWGKGRVFAPMDWGASASARPLDPRVREAREAIAWTQAAVNHFNHDQAPLWDSHTQMGIPLIGIGRSGAFFPTTFLHMLLPPKWSWLLAAWAKWIVAGLGVWVFSARFGLSSGGRFAGALVYAMSGLFVQMPHDAACNIAALAPWIMLVTSYLLMHATMWRTLALALLMALAMLGGDPSSIVAMVVLLLCMWGQVMIFSSDDRRIAIAPVVGAIVFAVALAVLVTAIQTFPTIEYFATLPKISDPNAFHWTRLPLISFLANAPWYSSGWIGTIALFLAGWGLARLWNRREVHGWLTLLGLWAIVWVGLIAVLASEWPAVAQALSGPGALIGLLMPLSIFAGMGLDAIAESVEEHARKEYISQPMRLAAIFVAAFGAAAIFFYLPPGSLASALIVCIRLLIAAVILALAGLIVDRKNGWSRTAQISTPTILLILLVLESVGSAILVLPTSKNPSVSIPQDSPLAKLVATKTPSRIGGTWGVYGPSLGLAVGYDDVRGEPALPRSLAEGLIAKSATTRPSDSVNQLCNIRYWAGSSNSVDKLSIDAPRVWMVKSASYFRSRSDVIAQMSQDGGFDPHGTVLVDSDVDNPNDEPLGLKPDGSDDPRWYQESASGNLPTVQYKQRSEEVATVDINGGGSGWLVVADRLYPGWHVRLWSDTDNGFFGGVGRDVPIIPAFGFVRAVFLPEHTGRAMFTYEPRSWRFGCYGSLMGLAALMLLAGTALLGHGRTDES